MGHTDLKLKQLNYKTILDNLPWAALNSSSI